MSLLGGVLLALVVTAVAVAGRYLVVSGLDELAQPRDVCQAQELLGHTAKGARQLLLLGRVQLLERAVETCSVR